MSISGNLVFEDFALPIQASKIETKYGTLIVAQDRKGVCGVGLNNSTSFTRRFPDGVHMQPVESLPAAIQLCEFFDGKRKVFDLNVNMGPSSSFQQEVYRSMCSIPYGSTRSYSELAESVGSPGAVRAVGTCCSHNPIPFIMPCHRVLKKDGSIGNYAFGVSMKKQLLDMEIGN